MDQDQTWDRLIDTQMQGSNSFCWALRRFRKSSNHKSSHQITFYVSVVTEKIQVVVLENLIKWILQVKSPPCPTVWQNNHRFHGWIPIFDGQTVKSHFFHGWTSSKPHFFWGETSDFLTITKPMLFLLNSSYLVENIHLRWSPKTARTTWLALLVYPWVDDST